MNVGFGSLSGAPSFEFFEMKTTGKPRNAAHYEHYFSERKATGNNRNLVPQWPFRFIKPTVAFFFF